MNLSDLTPFRGWVIEGEVSGAAAQKARWLGNFFVAQPSRSPSPTRDPTSRARGSRRARQHCLATVSPLSRSRAAPSGDGPTPWKKPGSCPATLHGTGRSRMTYLGPHLTGPGVRTGSPPPPGSRLAVTTLACGPVRRRAHPVEGTPDPAPPPSSGRADLG